MEQIIVEGLEVFGYHGVYEQEKEEGQIFVVNCWIDTSFAGAIHSDDLSNTVDYGNVCLFIKKYFAENKRKKKKNLSLEYFLSVKLFAGIQRQNRRIYQKNMCYNKYRKIIACSFQK